MQNGQQQSARWFLQKLVWPTFVLWAGCSLLLLQILWPTLSGNAYIEDDLGNFSLPVRYFYGEGLKSGRLDLWCPLLFGGYYLHGEGQAGMLHPLHLLLYKFLSAVTGMGIELLLVYISMFIGCYVLFRLWELTNVAAAFGAFVFAFCGPNILAIVHINRVGIVAHAPWAMACIHLCMRRHSWTRVAGFAGVVLINTSAILLGYPFFFLVSALLQAWYALYLTTSGQDIRRLCFVGLAIAWSLPAGAVQLIPTAQTLAESRRAQPTLEFLATGSLLPVELVQFVNPYLLAGRKGAWLGPQEIGLYSGAIPALLFLWVCFRRPVARRRLVIFLAGLGAIGLFLAMGKYNGLHHWYAGLPIIGFFRVPARYFLLTHFAVAAGSAIAFDHVRTNISVTPSPVFSYLLSGWTVAAVATVLTIPLATAFRPQLLSHLTAVPLIAFGVGLVCVSTFLSYIVLVRGNARYASALLGVAVLDIAVFSGTYLRSLRVASPDVYESLRPAVPPPGPVWVENATTLLDGPMAIGYAQPDGYVGLAPGGVLPYESPAYRQLLGVKAVLRKGQWSVEPQPLPFLRFAEPVLASSLEALTEIASARTRAAVGSAVQVDTHTGTAVLRTFYPGFFSADLRTKGRALCVTAQRFHAGWKATVDGRPLDLLRVNGDFTGFVLPGGAHTVILQFEPPDLRMGAAISVASLVALAIFCAYTGRRSRMPS